MGKNDPHDNGEVMQEGIFLVPLVSLHHHRSDEWQQKHVDQADAPVLSKKSIPKQLIFSKITHIILSHKAPEIHLKVFLVHELIL